MIGFTLGLVLDNNYGASNKHIIEIQVKQKQVLVNGEVGLGWIKSVIKEQPKYSDPPEIRITVSDSSNDETVRGLFHYLVERCHFEAQYSIGIK
jgi:hypothetical protein